MPSVITRKGKSEMVECFVPCATINLFLCVLFNIFLLNVKNIKKNLHISKNVVIFVLIDTPRVARLLERVLTISFSRNVKINLNKGWGGKSGMRLNKGRVPLASFGVQG